MPDINFQAQRQHPTPRFDQDSAPISNILLPKHDFTRKDNNSRSTPDLNSEEISSETTSGFQASMFSMWTLPRTFKNLTPELTRAEREAFNVKKPINHERDAIEASG